MSYEVWDFMYNIFMNTRKINKTVRINFWQYQLISYFCKKTVQDLIDRNAQSLKSAMMQAHM